MRSGSPERSISGSMIRETRPGLGDRKHDAVGDVDRLLDRVGDEDEGLVLVGAQPDQVFLEFPPVLLVDRRKRFIEEQHVGIDRQRPRQADALAHAARKLVRIFVLEAGKADFGDVVAGDRPRVRPWPCRAVRDRMPTLRSTVAQGISAKSWNTKARSGPGALTRLPSIAICSGIGLDQPGDDLQQRGLAAAAGAEKARQLAARKVEIDAAQRFGVAVGLGNAPHLHDRIDWCGHRRSVHFAMRRRASQAPLFSGLKTRISTHCSATSVRVERAMIEAIVAYISA